MGMPKGRKIDARALMERRLAARRLLDAGNSQAEVARKLAVSREAVRKWANLRVLELQQITRQGRKSAINEVVRGYIRAGLERGPIVNGLPTGATCTIFQVQQLLKKHTGREYSKSYAWRLRRDLGPSSHT
jgi:transposase